MLGRALQTRTRSFMYRAGAITGTQRWSDVFGTLGEEDDPTSCVPHGVMPASGGHRGGGYGNEGGR